LFAGFWRLAISYGVCWLAGSFLGCALTGHPWEFLFQSMRLMFGVFGGAVVTRQLVTELHPSQVDMATVLSVVTLLLCRKIFLGWNARAILNPVFMMMVLGWLLGLEIARFWYDFGIPAFIVWVALELQEHFEKHLAFDSARRLLIVAGISIGTFFGYTSDTEGRWTANLATEIFLTPATPDIGGWLPQPGGIIYNADARVFYQTFFRNPTADWRYILGFEPGLMQPEDLKVFRNIQWNYQDGQGYEPWVEKMRPQDRMIMQDYAGTPDIPELEWHNVGGKLWIGRLKSNSSTNGTKE
jgi:hypothetical protein